MMLTTVEINSEPEVELVTSETGYQLFNRLISRPSLKNLCVDLVGELELNDVIEVSGGAGCGKTELLYHLIVKCILPLKWKIWSLNGFDAGVIFIDTDYHFSMDRLLAVLREKIQSCLKANSSEADGELDCNIEQIVDECAESSLDQLSIVRCETSEELLLTLSSFKYFLCDKDNVSLIIVDSISSFYWLDRMNFMDNYKLLEDYRRKLVNVLKKILNDFELILIATKQNIMNPKSGANDKSGSSKSSCFEFMGRDWQRFVDHRIMLKLSNDVNEDVTKVIANIVTKSNVIHYKELRITSKGLIVQS